MTLIGHLIGTFEILLLFGTHSKDIAEADKVNLKYLAEKNSLEEA